MSRKLSAAALAVAVAGGVYLSGASAEASNMGFKLERSFATVRGGSGDFLNIYLLSFPLYNGLGDIADSNHPAPNSRCVGDTAGPTAGDGEINADDAICDLWTDRSAGSDNSFAFSRFDRDTCGFQPAIASWDSFGGFSYGGTPFVLAEADAAYQINTTVPTGAPTVTNRAVIVGSHDPGYPGREIRRPASGCSPANDYLNLPYHTMYQESAEVLCGLKGVQWVDANGDTLPDNCWVESDLDGDGNPDFNGVLDAGETASGIFAPFDGSAITVLTFDNDADGLGNDNNYIAQIVSYDSFGGLAFSAPSFSLRPGDGYLINIAPNHQITTWLSPHF